MGSRLRTVGRSPGFLRRNYDPVDLATLDRARATGSLNIQADKLRSQDGVAAERDELPRTGCGRRALGVAARRIADLRMEDFPRPEPGANSRPG